MDVHVLLYECGCVVAVLHSAHRMFIIISVMIWASNVAICTCRFIVMIALYMYSHQNIEMINIMQNVYACL